jgi:starch synthase
VRVMFLVGREGAARQHAWAAADLFLSPSDSIQETFGLTPVEAMAAGLPVVVSDYDGYRDTVRDGVDGFRVPTWAPVEGMGVALARAYEDKALNYDQYCWGATASTVVELAAYADAVCALVESPDLRRRMGEAGRARARAEYDWSVVFAKYRTLWGELDARRRAALADPVESAWIGAAPTALPGRLDPFRVFGHYPTRGLDGETRLTLAPGATNRDLAEALAHPLFAALSIERSAIEAVFAAAAKSSGTRLSVLAGSDPGDLPIAVRTAGLLVKMGLAVVQNPRE